MWHFAEFEPSTEDWKLILSSGFIAGAHELLILGSDLDKGWEHVREILDEDMLTERSISVDKFTIGILIICTLNFGDKIIFIHIDQAQPSVFLVKLFQAEVIEMSAENLIINRVPPWVAAATHLVFGWTMALVYPLGDYASYQRVTEQQ